MTGRQKRRLWRGAIALLVSATGAVGLVLGMLHGQSHQAHTSHVDYAFRAIVGRGYLLLLAGAVLVLMGRNLFHGKRTAWWTCMAALLVLLSTVRWFGGDIALLVMSLLSLVALLAARRLFHARSDPALKRQGLYLLVGGEILMLLYGAVGLYWLDKEFRHESTVLSSFHDAARLLFLLPVSNEPITRHGEWFVDSVRAGVFVVLVLGLGALVRAVTSQPGFGADRKLVQSILADHGKTGLAHFHLLDDKAWFFSSDRGAFIGYRVIGTTAVALGGPVGPEESSRLAIAEFLDFCELNGWTVGFYQLTEPERNLLGDTLPTAKIGEEAIIEVQSWADEGKEYKSLRSALRRCERAGYRLVELAHPISDVDLARIKEVSDDWAADGAHRERTFTLGRFDADYLRSTPVVAVVDGNDTVQAFANLLPPYRDRNASFDLMRRRTTSVNGVMDFLFVGLIHRFAQEGYDGMNLGLAPFANIEDDGTVKTKVMRTMYERLNAVFNYTGLYAFKNKWHPRWEPRYLAYASESEFAKVAAATARAGELRTKAPLQRVASFARTFPASCAFLVLQLWLMTATYLHPHLARELLRGLGLNWSQLTHGELWRVFTAPLIQVKPGFVVANVALFFLIPLAEWRLKAYKLAGIYMFGDVISSLITLFGVRAAYAWGNAEAGKHLAEIDAGTSSGSIAVIAAAFWSIPDRRWRYGTLGAGLVTLVMLVIFDNQLFDLQHLLAGLTGLGLAVGWQKVSERRASRTTA